MKIIYSANTDWSLYNFRCAQIESTLKQGWEIGCICSKGPFIEPIEKLGVNKIFLLQNYKKNIDLISDLSLILEYYRIYRQWKPEIVHQFTIKPVIYGTIAARLARIPVIINTIPGLGYVFSDTEKERRILKTIVLFLYKIAGKLNDFMFFQNEDDKRLFINHKIVSKDKTLVIPGSGVDTQHYSQDKINKEIIDQIKKDIKYKPNQIIILMVSRMLYHKGIAELAECSKRVKRIRMRGGLGGSFPYPQDILNAGRNIKYNFQGAWNGARGYPAPVNPSPTWQPIGQSKTPMLAGEPIDLQQAQQQAQQQAGTI